MKFNKIKYIFKGIQIMAFYFLTVVFLLTVCPKNVLAQYEGCDFNTGHEDCSKCGIFCKPGYTVFCNKITVSCTGTCHQIGDYTWCELPGTKYKENCACTFAGGWGDTCNNPPWGDWWGEWVCDTSTCCKTRGCKKPLSLVQVGNCNGGTCGGACGGPGPTSQPSTPSCIASITPDQTTVRLGGSDTLTVTTIANNGTVTGVGYYLTNNNVSVNPSQQTSSPPFQTRVTGVSEGTSSVTAYIHMGNYFSVCGATSNIVVLPAGPWWQAKDANLTTSGNLASIIPSGAANQNLILDGEGGFPGVALYNGVIDVGNGTISSKNWSVNSLSTSTKNYSYAYFSNQIPSDAVINIINGQSITQSDLMSASADQYKGYYWFKYDGEGNGLDLSIDSNVNLSTRKVILLVENADLYINGKIKLTDGEGFFATIVGENQNGEKGNILINPLVGGAVGSNPSLEGIYLADNRIMTGVGDTQLYIRGSLAALGGLIMERDLGNNSLNPSEYFEFAPDQILLFPSQLNIRRYSWREIAP